jgi:large subunit ribosomal protein L9
MKVILIKDVARLGRKSEIREVPNGHALNFLIPQKLAIPATPENMKRVNEGTKKLQEQKSHADQLFADALTALSPKTLAFTVDANEKGSLYKGIGVEDLVHFFEQQGYGIRKHDIILAHPIKETGMHEIALVRGSLSGVCHLEVIKG